MLLIPLNFPPKCLRWSLSFISEILKLSYIHWTNERFDLNYILFLFPSQKFLFWRFISTLLTGIYITLCRLKDLEWRTTLRLTAWDTAALPKPACLCWVFSSQVARPSLKRKLFSPPVSDDPYFLLHRDCVFSSIFCISIVFNFSYWMLSSVQDTDSLEKNWWFCDEKKCFSLLFCVIDF